MEKAKIKEFRKKYMFRKGERLGPTQILSKHLEKPMYMNDNTDNLVLLGGQEDEVTENYIIPNVLQMTGSYIVHDVGGHLYEKLSPVLKEYGYAVHNINLESCYSKCDNYNPLEYIHDEEDMTVLIDCIMKNATPENPAHEEKFLEAEQHLLKAGIHYLLEHCKDMNKKNLHGLREMFASEEICEDKQKVKERLDPMFLELPKERIARVEYQKYQELANPERELDVIESCLCRLTDYYQDEAINKNTLKLEKIGEQRMALFITARHHSRSYFTNLIPVIMHQAYRTITGCKKNKYPVTFVLDQCRGINGIPDLEKMLTNGKESRISFIIAANALSSLEDYYSDGILKNKDLWNCFNLIYMGGADSETVTYIENRLKAYSQSDKKYWKHINALDLRSSDWKESLVLMPFADPIVDKKYDGRKHPLYYLVKGHK